MGRYFKNIKGVEVPFQYTTMPVDFYQGVLARAGQRWDKAVEERNRGIEAISSNPAYSEQDKELMTNRYIQDLGNIVGAYNGQIDRAAEDLTQRIVSEKSHPYYESNRRALELQKQQDELSLRAKAMGQPVLQFNNLPSRLVGDNYKVIPATSLNLDNEIRRDWQKDMDESWNYLLQTEESHKGTSEAEDKYVRDDKGNIIATKTGYESSGWKGITAGRLANNLNKVFEEYKNNPSYAQQYRALTEGVDPNTGIKTGNVYSPQDADKIIYNQLKAAGEKLIHRETEYSERYQYHNIPKGRGYGYGNDTITGVLEGQEPMGTISNPKESDITKYQERIDEAINTSTTLLNKNTTDYKVSTAPIYVKTDKGFRLVGENELLGPNTRPYALDKIGKYAPYSGPDVENLLFKHNQVAYMRDLERKMDYFGVEGKTLKDKLNNYKIALESTKKINPLMKMPSSEKALKNMSKFIDLTALPEVQRYLSDSEGRLQDHPTKFLDEDKKPYSGINIWKDGEAYLTKASEGQDKNGKIVGQQLYMKKIAPRYQHYFQPSKTINAAKFQSSMMVGLVNRRGEGVTIPHGEFVKRMAELGINVSSNVYNDPALQAKVAKALINNKRGYINITFAKPIITGQGDSSKVNADATMWTIDNGNIVGDRINESGALTYGMAGYEADAKAWAASKGIKVEEDNNSNNTNE